MFIPYRCEDCIHGEYISQDDCWKGCGVKTDEECEQRFVEDERM